MNWLKDPEGIRRWWNRVLHSKVTWWHYVLAFIAFAAGYWVVWTLGF